MKKLMVLICGLAAPLAGFGQFTNIVLPGNWPTNQWWLSNPPPSAIVSSQAWAAVNENFRRTSNAIAGITSGSQTPWAGSEDAAGNGLSNALWLTFKSVDSAAPYGEIYSFSGGNPPVSSAVFLNAGVNNDLIVQMNQSLIDGVAFSSVDDANANNLSMEFRASLFQWTVGNNYNVPLLSADQNSVRLMGVPLDAQGMAVSNGVFYGDGSGLSTAWGVAFETNSPPADMTPVTGLVITNQAGATFYVPAAAWRP